MTMGYEDSEDPRREEMMARIGTGFYGMGKDYYKQRRKALGGPRTYRSDGGRIR